MRWRLDCAFLLMGFTFTIAQTVLARELLVAFSGNELAIGLVLGSWLLLEAAGSAGAGRWADRLPRHPRVYALLQMVLALALPLTLLAAFGIRTLAGIRPGEGIGPGTTAVASLLLLLPVGLVDGAMFTAGCHVVLGSAFAPIREEAAGVPSVTRVYALEAVGGILGGFLFTWVLVQRGPALSIAMLLAILNLGSALSLLWEPAGGRGGFRDRWLALACGVLLGGALVALSPQVSRALNRAAQQWQWSGQDVAFYQDSPYGNVAVLRAGEQITVFANGLPVLTAPVPDVMYVEELVHLPMLWVEDPGRALVLGGGAGGVLRELEKYPWARLDYAELDPTLIEAVQANPTSLTEEELRFPALHLEIVDGRRLVRLLAEPGPLPPEERYDLILMNVPYPSTLLLNRFYTREMFLLSKALLKDSGILAFALPGSLNYLSPGQQALHKGVQATLATVFPHVQAIPGESTLWLASGGVSLTSPPSEERIQRWQARSIPTRMLTKEYLDYKFLPAHRAWLEGTLAAAPTVPANTDLRPSGVLAGLTYWNELFAPSLSGFFLSLARLPYLALALAVLVLGLLLTFGSWRNTWGRETTVMAALAFTGFGGMAADLLIIFAFQALQGYLYSQIGALVASFMAGVALGSWSITRRMYRAPETAEVRRWFVATEGLLVGFWTFLPLLLWGMAHPSLPRWASWALPPGLYALNALAGLLVGFQFPLAARLLGASGRVAGALYAADLVGAFVGALGTATVLMPAVGIMGTCGLVGLLKLGSLGAVAAQSRGA